MYGVFADVAAFRSFGAAVIEDCAQAFAPPGTAPLAGDVVVTSFHPTKCLTTGEGGYAIARDPSLNKTLRILSDGGGTARGAFGPMSELAAALGLSQLARYGGALARRAALAATYERALGHAAARLRAATPADRTMHFRFVMHAPGGLASATSFFALRGISVRRGVDQLLHRRAGLADSAFATTCRHFDCAVSVPLHPSLCDEEAARCAEALAVWCGSLPD
jgi:UDP-4-amino-4-deoxy-L-arabinose-oxoglutarate aminotransferase